MSRISLTLVSRNDKICCAACGNALAGAGESWKRHAVVSALPVKALPGAGSGVDEQVVLRRFACPNCARLLDTETALPDDPFLEDVVAVLKDRP
jgi:acetone carboxylase gamma subunit